MKRGYFLIAFGRPYITEACNLVKTLNKFGNTYPISILSSESDKEYIESFSMFERVIIYNFDNEFSKIDKTHFEKYGGTPKILMTDYSPYEETIFLDSDVLVQSNPNFLWELLNSMNEPYIVTGGKCDKEHTLAKVISQKINKKPEELNLTHSGFVYFNKANYKFNFFTDKLKFYWKNYYEENLNVSFFRQGKADEHAIFATINTNNICVIDPTIIPTITHNYHYDIELPSNIVTGGNRYSVLKILESPPPFIHMFRDGGGNHYELLYERLMNI